VSGDELQCICAGHVCLDIIPEFPVKDVADVTGLLQPGSLCVIGRARLSPGGPVSNVGLALHKLGIATEFMGKVGDDLFGRGLLQLFAPFGADRGMAVVAGEVTSYTVVIAPPGVDRIFLHSPGANDTYCAADVDYLRLEVTPLFHLGYPPLMRRLYEDDGRELEEIMRRAKKAGATTSLDMAFPDPASPAGQVGWRRVLERVLPHVDIFLPSAEELMFMCDRDRFFRLREEADRDPVLAYTGEDLRFLARESLALGAGIAGLKAGRRGIFLATGTQDRLDRFGRARPGRGGFADRELWQPAYRVERVVSATGSGDNAIAGFLAAFLNGHELESCLAVSSAVGADNVGVLDATSGVRSWEETLDSIPGHEPTDPQAGPGFTFDETRRLWRGRFDGAGLPR
jgi:sugar/nucleoside kinase (ribokinase family)